jgi:hypothetical protein
MVQMNYGEWGRDADCGRPPFLGGTSIYVRDTMLRGRELADFNLAVLCGTLSLWVSDLRDQSIAAVADFMVLACKGDLERESLDMAATPKVTQLRALA